MQKIVIEVSEAQAKAFESLGIDTTKAMIEFASAGVNNKLKSGAMSQLKRTVLSGEETYKKLPPIMKSTMTCAEFIATLSRIYYDVAQSLGGRTMKPLDELVREILSGESAVTVEE